jgi:SAM-dependent methyltransferase
VIWQALRFMRKAVAAPEPARAPSNVFRSLLRHPRFFEPVATLIQLRDFSRLRQLAKDRSRASDAPLDDYYAQWLDYNLDRTLSRTIATGRAVENLLPALVLPLRNVALEKLLVVGPRTVQELYLCWLYGYSWKNISAIDLYSTNPKIAVMNMEAMTFEDATFDAIVSSNTLTYAKDLGGCFREIARVLRPGGRLAFTHSYFPENTDLATMRVSGKSMRTSLEAAGLAICYANAREFVNSKGGAQTAHHIVARKTVGAPQPHDSI